MNIKNYRSFVSALLCMLCSLACCLVLLMNGFHIKYLVGILITLALGIVTMKSAFHDNVYQNAFISEIDERDVYITMKSGYVTLRVINSVLFTMAICMILLYGIVKVDIFIIIAMTLCAMSIMIFAILYFVNRHYEKCE